MRTAGTTDLREVRTRALGDVGIALRADDDETKRFVGHAAVFNSRTAIGNPLKWGWYEQVSTGAFSKTLQEGDARFLVDHDTAMLVARVSAGDLRLSEDSIGLAVDSDLDTELSYVRDLLRNVEKRRITGMSFGFYVVRDEWTTETVETSDGQTAEVDVRTILEVRLLEVSAVTFPAYEETDAGLRSLAENLRSLHGIPEPAARASGDRAPADKATRGETEDAPAVATRPRFAQHRQRLLDATATRFGL